MCLTLYYGDETNISQQGYVPYGWQLMMDIVEYKYGNGSIIITSQIPVSEWHALIGEGTIADAILDRLVHSSHHIELSGTSMRRKKSLNQ